MRSWSNRTYLGSNSGGDCQVVLVLGPDGVLRVIGIAILRSLVIVLFNLLSVYTSLICAQTFWLPSFFFTFFTFFKFYLFYFCIIRF